MVVQGPPGTGKTYKMASLIAGLPEEASVLVTALTNRALMELAGKDSLEKKLEAGCVYKTSLTTDEQKELPKLQRIEGTDIHCIPGNLTLATFYAASNWAKKIDDQPPFDYVIMDEASQGFFVMVCAAKKLGKKVIWIGDQCQMPPVINMNPDKLLEKNWGPLLSGFKTLCENFSYPSYLLSDTYRLTERACAFTGIFYKGALRSVADMHNDLPVANLSPGGGPSLLLLPLEPGNRSPKNMIDTALSMVKDLLAYNSKLEIAILSKFRATVKNMQRAFITHFGEQKNVLIDTVERVQGLTCDVCFFCIPNDLQYMSLEKTFFNVATSRSIFNTVIICDENLLNTVNMDTEVRNYLERVKSNSVPAIEKPAEAGQQPGLKVVGKIDLSKFERKKKEISELKRNYYVIDTNVFVNCPDIIDKINKDYPVILSAKVVDELDKMKIKLDEQGKRNAEKALRYLNSSPAHEIIYEQADTSLLPDDFDKRSPDNLILSVALKYKHENPIILTSDNGLQLKAKILNINTLSLKDYLRK
ncbi:MAG: AAA family ATPase [Bacteroidales bacterium]|nr:AAA family ATPase [Bacteroidales bacterium]